MVSDRKEATPSGVVTQKELYLQKRRRSQGITYKAQAPGGVRVSGFLLFKVKMNVQKGEF